MVIRNPELSVVNCEQKNAVANSEVFAEYLLYRLVESVLTFCISGLFQHLSINCKLGTDIEAVDGSFIAFQNYQCTLADSIGAKFVKNSYFVSWHPE